MQQAHRIKTPTLVQTVGIGPRSNHARAQKRRNLLQVTNKCVATTRKFGQFGREDRNPCGGIVLA